jgi:hypothetical protein
MPKIIGESRKKSFVFSAAVCGKKKRLKEKLKSKDKV